jgi:hypothetical protein
MVSNKNQALYLLEDDTMPNRMGGSVDRGRVTLGQRELWRQLRRGGVRQRR